MPRPSTLRAFAPALAAALSFSALCSQSSRAEAQEFQVGPQPQQAPQLAPQQAPQLAPLPPQQPGPTTVIIQQQPYPAQGYPQQYQPPPYPPQPYYVQQPAPPAAPAPPRVIKNWEGGPIPAGYHEETHARIGLVIGGAVTFGTFYLFSALGASISNDTGTPASALYIPALGPFIQMGQSSSSTGQFLLAVDGVAQLGGITMFMCGLAFPRHELVRNDFGVQWSVAPLVGRGQQGMGLVGRF